MKRTSWSAGLSVSGDGTGVVAHAGSAGLRLLADRTGLTATLSAVLARRSFTPVHDRGRVLTDVAVMLADGGEAIADIAVLGHQCALLGPVASAPTVWRTLAELSAARLAKVDEARARVRRHVWSQLPGGVPASKVADSDLGDVVVLDVDATIVAAHSEKEAAAPTFKGNFGFHPIAVWCDNTTELLAAQLRPGNAGANTTADRPDLFRHQHDRLTQGLGQSEPDRVLHPPAPNVVEAGEPVQQSMGSPGAISTNQQVRSTRLPGGPSPCPRPRRGSHPPRQRHWPGPIPVARLRHQHRLAERRGDRSGPDRLAAAARVERPAGQSRTQGPALPATARPRPTDAQRPTPTPTATGHLALGQ